MKNPSVMGHSFSQVPSAEIQRSSFERSRGRKSTFDADDLVPIFVDEVLPGDTFNVNPTCFARMSTPITPVMDNIHLETFFFFVPNRLVWDNWNAFMGENDASAGIDDRDFLVPEIVSSAAGYPEAGLHDHLGLPLRRPLLRSSALYSRAYRLIWNEWFRDQNLQDPITVNKDDGPDNGDENAAINLDALLKRNKRPDYFTSCLPYPQKGDAVTIGAAADTLPVTASGDERPRFGYLPGGAGSNTDLVALPNPQRFVTAQFPPAAASEMYWSDPNLEVDFSAQNTAITINEFREAFQVQRLLERDARGGTRYTEIIQSHFGVTSPDHRLQRPEYLGGGRTAVNMHSVPQTTPSDGASPQGNLAAYGTAMLNGGGFTKSFTEHGIIIGMANVRADLTYHQGLPRAMSRRTKYDYYWPGLAHLGEQAVLNKEIFVNKVLGNEDIDNAVFGYQERYGEYRYANSEVCGLFRPEADLSLDVWHVAEDFNSLPGLTDTFIQSNTPMTRVLAVATEPHFIFDGYFKVTCARPMPLYGVPGYVDHF